MLRHINMSEAADLVENSVREVLMEGKHITRDIGGNASTEEYTEALIKKIKERKNELKR